MDTRYLAHLAAGSDFYELAWADSGTADLAVDDVPGRWRREERGPWLVYRDDAEHPDAGWKVHVAVRPERARSVVPAVVELCLRSGVAVKTLRSTRLVRLTQAKYSPPAGSGKVVTAYPVDEAALERLVTSLADLLRGEPGFASRARSRSQNGRSPSGSGRSADCGSRGPTAGPFPDCGPGNGPPSIIGREHGRRPTRERCRPLSPG